MTQTNFENLVNIRNENKNKEIVFCSGSFDLTHAGHVLFLEDCKKHGDFLVVGVGSGAGIKLKGKGLPILNKYLRLKIVSSLKPVDCAFLIPDDIEVQYELEKVKICLEKLKPDKYVINSDASDIPYRQKISKECGVELIILERSCPTEFENISTTKIIEKIRKYVS
ncbi:MAG: adenylyltransferase/cytidyltransferase family protein [Candidatus Staskawiczbacteria bacterium]|nr:adenylyltransferase/cytidyltransferase family protein [Candidatus Staskawiczbacteria bacterium]